ncbi:hypothetical protein EYF80_057323 [Liparis tanakae]|uniref:Uncharacterized protein n=1 Tax=Liparis tanakae TaxID=230148 RepID=A0A4Z2EUJ0_9TELE|nr:hypothetical protein EYF80_057323 [Liparis tanakae]
MNSLLAAEGRKWSSGAGGLGGGISSRVFSSCFLRASLAAAWLLAWSAMELTPPPPAALDMEDGLTAEAPPMPPAAPPAAAACMWASCFHFPVKLTGLAMLLERDMPGLEESLWPCSWEGLGAMTRCDIIMGGRLALAADLMTV